MSPSDSTVLFRALPTSFRLSSAEHRELREFAARLTKSAGGRGFTCLITSDEEIRKLNREFRQKDKSTDVLSFPSEAGPQKLRKHGPVLQSVSETLGDIAISVERATEQAREFGHSRVQEISILMLHGWLHLRGFDHEQDEGEMARAEAEWCERLGLPLTLIARIEHAGATR